MLRGQLIYLGPLHLTLGLSAHPKILPQVTPAHGSSPFAAAHSNHSNSPGSPLSASVDSGHPLCFGLPPTFSKGHRCWALTRGPQQDGGLSLQKPRHPWRTQGMLLGVMMKTKPTGAHTPVTGDEGGADWWAQVWMCWMAPHCSGVVNGSISGHHSPRVL